MSKKKPQICPSCDAEALLTDDHILPKWLTKNLNLWGITIVIIGNRQKICQPCNTKKAGKIDYKDPGVKEFIRAFIDELNKKIK